MKIKTYKAGPNARYGADKARDLGEILESIGDVTPSAVVEAARAESSPIHGLFTWDDFTAAEKYRQVEAGEHIRNLHIVVERGGQEVETRAFHSIKVRTSGGQSADVYRHISIISASEEMRDQVLERAKGEIVHWRNRYRQYQGIFGEVFEAVDRLPIGPQQAQSGAAVA